MDVILQAENKCFPPGEKHLRKGESLLNNSMIIAVETRESPL